MCSRFLLKKFPENGGSNSKRGFLLFVRLHLNYIAAFDNMTTISKQTNCGRILLTSELEALSRSGGKRASNRCHSTQSHEVSSTSLMITLSLALNGKFDKTCLPDLPEELWIHLGVVPKLG